MFKGPAMTNDTPTAEDIVDTTDAEAAVILTTNGDESDIDAHTAPQDDVHPASLGLWMLALHIDHLTQSARGAGGSATHVDVAKDALEMLSEVYDD